MDLLLLGLHLSKFQGDTGAHLLQLSKDKEQEYWNTSPPGCGGEREGLALPWHPPVTRQCCQAGMPHGSVLETNLSQKDDMNTHHSL